MFKKAFFLIPSSIGAALFSSTSNSLGVLWEEEEDGDISALMSEKVDKKPEKKLVEVKIKTVDQSAPRNEDICDTDCVGSKVVEHEIKATNLDDADDPE